MLKNLLWKTTMILMALAALMTMGGFAEGTVSFLCFAVALPLLTLGIRLAWGRADYWERRTSALAAVRRARNNAARPVQQECAVFRAA